MGQNAKKLTGWPTTVLAVLGALAALVVVLLIFGAFHLPDSSTHTPTSALPSPDAPPFEFVYLDSLRVNSYLGQVEGGLSTSEQRTLQQTNTVSEGLNAGLSGGTAAVQYSNSQSLQEGTQQTVTATSADRFYRLLRLLREGSLQKCAYGRGAGASRWLWLVGVSADPMQAGTLESAIRCAGVGMFIRLTNMQLFLPPFAQVLPSAQSVTTVYGEAPWRRFPFTSATQSTKPADIARYVKAIGRNPRMPFIGAPFGSPSPIGGGGDNVTFFLPMAYHALTFEPSLLNGPVSVVGKIVAFAITPSKPAYIDYPTISAFGPALLKQSWAFDNRLGVCATAPPQAVLAKPNGAWTSATDQVQTTCASPHTVLAAIRQSVTVKAPYVVVLPLAIYQ